jgi:Polysaccharide lyase
MHIFLLLALLSLPLRAFGGTIYFQAHAETGTIAEWKAGGGGDCFTTNPFGGNPNGCPAVQEQAHGGRWAFKHNLPNPAQNTAQKFLRWDYQGSQGIQLGQTMYFSAWYYIGAGFGSSVGTKWTNIMQWKDDISPFNNTLFLGLRYSGGVRQIYMYHWACDVQHAVPCVTFPGITGTGLYTQVTPKPVPFQQWFHLEARYTAARTNGRLTVWQDGVQIFDFRAPNFNTFDSETTGQTSLQFGVGNYVSDSITGQQLLYTDDIYITDYQVFPQQSPPMVPTSLRIVY